MTNLSSFAQLMKEAAEEKKRREEAEAERKLKEVTPLLSELFSTVAKGKEKASELPGKDQIIKLVTELEEKIEEAPKVVEKEDSTEEKKLVKMFNRLQSDFQALKKHVETKTSGGYGSSGGGEVKILRMDDVDPSGLQDGATMVWSATLNKFVLALPTSGGGTTTDEEMPFSKRIDFITDNLLYRGEAIVGASETDPVWRIRRVTIGSDSDITEVWAGGSSQYIYAWSDRLTLNYT